MTPTQRLPRDILDRVAMFVREHGVKRLCTFALVCRSYHQAAMPHLYHDPTQVLNSEWRWRSRSISQRSLQLQNVLSSQPELAKYVRQLNYLTEIYAHLHYSTPAGELLYRIIVACPNVEELQMPIRLQRSVLFAAVTASKLSRLRRLVLHSVEELAQDWPDDSTIAQTFCRVFRPPNAKLESLELHNFGSGAYNSSVVVFDVTTLKLNEVFDAWSFVETFVRGDSLRTIEIDSTKTFVGDRQITCDDLASLSASVSPFLRRFSARENSDNWTYYHCVTVDDYEDTARTKTSFCFDCWFDHPFPNLEELVLEGFSNLSILAIEKMANNFPSLRIVSFQNTSWNLDEWFEPEDCCGSFCDAIGSLVNLQQLHLGNLPLIRYEIAIVPVRHLCLKRHIEFRWQPCLNPQPYSNVAPAYFRFYDASDDADYYFSSPCSDQSIVDEWEQKHGYVLETEEGEAQPYIEFDYFYDNVWLNSSDAGWTTPSECSYDDDLDEDRFVDIDSTDPSLLFDAPYSTRYRDPKDEYFNIEPSDFRLEESYEALEEEEDIEQEWSWDEWGDFVDFDAADERWIEGEELETEFEGRRDEGVF